MMPAGFLGRVIGELVEGLEEAGVVGGGGAWGVGGEGGGVLWGDGEGEGKGGSQSEGRGERRSKGGAGAVDALESAIGSFCLRAKI